MIDDGIQVWHNDKLVKRHDTITDIIDFGTIQETVLVIKNTSPYLTLTKLSLHAPDYPHTVKFSARAIPPGGECTATITVSGEKLFQTKPKRDAENIPLPLVNTFRYVLVNTLGRPQP